MKALLATELRRMLHRPLVRAIAAAVLLAAAAAGGSLLFTSQKDTVAHIRVLETQYRSTLQRCETAGFNLPAMPSANAAARREFCVDEAVPAPPFTFHLTQLKEVFEGAGFKGSAAAFVILGFLVGATLIGAEWQSGNMATLLGWEPGRLRVHAAKAFLPAAVVAIAVVAGEIVLGGALTPAAAFRGTTEGVNAAWLLDVAGVAFRVAVVSALAAIAGASIAMIGRNTAAALGAGFVYALVEVLIRGFDNPAWQRWLVGENAAIFVTARAPVPPGTGFSPSIALLLLVLYVGSIVVAAAVSFLRRDAA